MPRLVGAACSLLTAHERRRHGCTGRNNEMTTYSNEAVLEALRRAQYRQVPWAKRPNVFDHLRALGLLELVRQRTVAPAPGFHAPVDIAVVTERGKLEFSRLARDERSMDWDQHRNAPYALAIHEPVLEARV
jgi:hypothetical protein